MYSAQCFHSKCQFGISLGSASATLSHRKKFFTLRLLPFYLNTGDKIVTMIKQNMFGIETRRTEHFRFRYLKVLNIQNKTSKNKKYCSVK